MEREQKNKETLEALAVKEINILSNMKQPIVRVCGPWTTGGFGYEMNLKRYIAAVKYLEEKLGLTVVDYVTSEVETIKGLGLTSLSDQEMVIDVYHKPILQAGLIKEAYMMPKWEESKGATWEYNFLKDNTDVALKDLPEEWITEMM